MRHIPNILSALRILMVGVFVYFFAKAQYLACLITYVTAFLTDLLDGFLARRNNWISNIGKVLDPLADKLMLLTALVCFLTRGWLPLYMIVIVLAKELIMIIGGAVLFRKKVVVYSDWYGKFASGFFNASVALTLAKRFFPQIGMLDVIVLGIAIVLALIALVHYARVQVLPCIRKGKS
jgi:CDP-diacylglycerol/glycerol-3-phosphate 3-phosphatidyltransferase